ncbi:MAG: hypothetical protein LW768_22410 [Rubrivivax sp.]|jgi:hypothetical protein|nr:hypothetical protein [Rubrivivax sp.]
MTYPTTLPIMVESTLQRLSGAQSARSTNGLLKTRVLFASDKYEFVLVHWLTSAQRAELETHYSGNRLNSFNFTWPGFSPILVVYGDPPQYSERSPGFHVATVRLLAV